MLYVVDGYNVTKSDPATRDLSLEEQRDALAARLRARGRELLGAGRIVVVFDGESGAGLSSAGGAPVEVRFSRGGSADDAIVEAIAGSVARGHAVRVITSDSGLAARVKDHGGAQVEVLGRETLFDAAGRGRARKGKTRYPASSAGIPQGGNEITAELKKLWLAEECEE